MYFRQEHTSAERSITDSVNLEGCVRTVNGLSDNSENLINLTAIGSILVSSAGEGNSDRKLRGNMLEDTGKSKKLPTYTVMGDTHKLCRRQKLGELLLHRFNERKDEESNHQLSSGVECDKDHLEQMDTPVSITLMMSCQTLINNAKVKRMDEANKFDPQDGWGKAVLFITNQSSKLHLSNMYLPVGRTFQ